MAEEKILPCSKCEELEKQIKELKQALKPFAIEINKKWDDDSIVTVLVGSNFLPGIVVGDFRRAEKVFFNVVPELN